MNETWEKERQRLSQNVREAALELLLHVGSSAALVELTTADAEPGHEQRFIAIGSARGIRTLVLDK
jgi:hypothetical protein